MNEILMPFGTIGKLAEEMKVSSPTVTKALRGKSSSLLSIRIREKAIKMGGVEAVHQGKGSLKLVEE